MTGASFPSLAPVGTIVRRPSAQLRADAEQIWWAGVRAVLPESLLRQCVRVEGGQLIAESALDASRTNEAGDSHAFDLEKFRKIAIVGAGKASGAMAAALEESLGPRVLAEKQVSGWVNVPADALVPTQHVHLHAARPPGVNEPRPEGVAGTRKILELIASLTADDLCICLLSGGGSALLPAPVPDISLDDKIRVTQLLSAAGADIEQLNTVRRPLSLVKGGGLARACRAGRLLTLVISDVLSDRLETIASGPTVASPTTASDALAVLDELNLRSEPAIESVVRYLKEHGQAQQLTPPTTQVTNLVIGNNAMAVAAAGEEAVRLGYHPSTVAANRTEGPAEEVGRHLAGVAEHLRNAAGPDCLISGGEPTVRLIDEAQRGLGGRNQQLALAALTHLSDPRGIALLSAGTDGEDGPTDAAGALVTEEIALAAQERSLDPADYLRRNDAYRFFGAVDGLFRTGPTHTNVCDLRVIAVGRD
jgi:hydroxypyruvate reductase